MQDRFMDEADFIQENGNNRNDKSLSGVSGSRPRNQNNNGRFMDSANTTAMAQNRSDANIFMKLKKPAN